jgi:hypothetical protein
VGERGRGGERSRVRGVLVLVLLLLSLSLLLLLPLLLACSLLLLVGRSALVELLLGAAASSCFGPPHARNLSPGAWSRIIAPAPILATRHVSQHPPKRSLSNPRTLAAAAMDQVKELAEYAVRYPPRNVH